jgi:hypothetical protein
MLETIHLNGDSDRFELGFRKREAAPEPAMKLGIRLHLAGLSLSNTIFALDSLGVGAVNPPFTTGCRRQTYSRQMVPIQITSRLTRP